MDKLITIISFHFPHEAHLVKGKLESEGIESFLQNELTVQTYNFIANNIGGVKLQVREQDYDAAYQILKEAGHFDSPEIPDKGWFVRFTRTSAHWPLLGKLRPEVRLLILIILMLLILIVPMVL